MPEMSNQWMYHANPHGEPRKLSTKNKVRFSDYVRPDPFPPDIELRLGLFWWMVKTAHAAQRGSQWGPLGLLSGKPTVGAYDVAPIVSIKDLDRRFHFALLSAYGERSRAWLDENYIEYSSVRWVYFPHYRGPGGRLVEKKMAQLFDTRGRLAVTLNSSHPLCNHVQSIHVDVTADGFRIVMSYGERYCRPCLSAAVDSMSGMNEEEAEKFEDQDLGGVLCAASDTGGCNSCGKDDALVSGSGWTHEVARTDAGEPFVDALGRALAWLEANVAPYSDEEIPHKAIAE